MVCSPIPFLVKCFLIPTYHIQPEFFVICGFLFIVSLLITQQTKKNWGLTVFLLSHNCMHIHYRQMLSHIYLHKYTYVLSNIHVEYISMFSINIRSIFKEKVLKTWHFIISINGEIFASSILSCHTLYIWSQNKISASNASCYSQPSVVNKKMKSLWSSEICLQNYDNLS